MTDDLQALSPLLHDMIVRIAQEAIDAGRQVEPKAVSADLGLSAGAMRRAGMHFTRSVSASDADISNGAAAAFTIAWSLGEQEAMRRVMTAITSPGTKGREVQVMQALMNGASVEEALAGRDSAPMSPPVTESGNVVTFRPQRVTEGYK